jgi:hypothetical protein
MELIGLYSEPTKFKPPLCIGVPAARTNPEPGENVMALAEPYVTYVPIRKLPEGIGMAGTDNDAPEPDPFELIAGVVAPAMS